ncbi:hypothetical protein HOP50_09g57310 [Chloropicon primus]|nr:hypothetical protein HOP50_09g57310 [Chloropicon primus]
MALSLKSGARAWSATAGAASQRGSLSTALTRARPAREESGIVSFPHPKLSLGESLALVATTAVALGCASSAEAKVVMKKIDSQKVFQPEVTQRQPKGPRKPRAKSGGGMSMPALSAPSVSVPTIGSGPVASIAPIALSVGALGAATVAASKADDGFWDFINEGMAKDVSSYVGGEEGLKDSEFFN